MPKYLGKRTRKIMRKGGFPKKKKSLIKVRRSTTLLGKLRYFPQKCVGILPIIVDDGGDTYQTQVFSRFDFQGIFADVYGINSPARFGICKRNYE